MTLEDNIRYTAWTVDEIAKLINVSPRFLYYEIENGNLIAHRLTARLIRVMPDDLKRWLDARRTLTGNQATQKQPA